MLRNSVLEDRFGPQVWQLFLTLLALIPWGIIAIVVVIWFMSNL